MGRRYNIINKIAKSKEPATIQIDEEHEFRINNSFAAAMAVNAYMEDKKLKDEEKFNKVFGTVFNQEANDYIKSLELPPSGYMNIFEVIKAAMMDEDLEEIGEAKEENTPSK